MHADFNRHPRLHLERRLNVLIYLNRDWRDEYGGAFELWNGEMTVCEAKVMPHFNRCVIFSTTLTSYHGHPGPLEPRRRDAQVHSPLLLQPGPAAK